MLKVLDLFSGIGGFSLGLERTGGFETVAFCEIDLFCRKVLAKHWPDVPIYEDVRKLHHGGPVDVICGGYPCQPFSHAGKRKGAEDDRHLWPAMLEVIKTHRPTWVIGENVAGHISMGLDEVLSDLEDEDYAVQTFVIPACAVGAWHRRDRVWIIAYPTQHGRNSLRIRPGENPKECGNPSRLTNSMGSDVPDAHPGDVQGLVGGGNDEKERQEQAERPAGLCCGAGSAGSGAIEPGLGGSADGISSWLDGSWEDGIPRTTKRTPGTFEGRPDRLKSLGNHANPQIIEMLGHAILEAERLK